MCYICAPNQFKFYGKERLTVCREFCDEMYDACADAVLKGSKINEIYVNGEEFCKSRRYNIEVLDNDNCFFFNVEPLLVNSYESKFNFLNAICVQFLYFFLNFVYF